MFETRQIIYRDCSEVNEKAGTQELLKTGSHYLLCEHSYRKGLLYPIKTI